MRTLAATWVMGFACASVFGWVLFQEIPPEQVPYDRPDPPGLRDLSNFKGRVHAAHLDAPTWGDGFESYDIYFRGDAYILNRFIKRYAELRRSGFHRNEPLTLTLQDAEVPPGRGWSGQPLPPYDWVLRITRGTITKARPPLLPDSTTTHVFLTVRISPRLLLSELKIPADVRVDSDTSFDQFVRAHEERRLGNRLAVLRRQIADLQQEIARLAAASQPAATQPASSGENRPR